MSFSTSPVFVLSAPKGWGTPGALSHPATVFLHTFAAAFDSFALKGPDADYKEYTADGYTFTSPEGEEFVGDAAWSKVLETYAPFSAHEHQPRFFSVSRNETDNGWLLIGQADVYFDFPVPATGEAKVKDLEGREWDLRVPGMFKFGFVEDKSSKHGLRIKTDTVFADGVPIVKGLIKRGMVGPEILTS